MSECEVCQLSETGRSEFNITSETYSLTTLGEVMVALERIANNEHTGNAVEFARDFIKAYNDNQSTEFLKSEFWKSKKV